MYKIAVLLTALICFNAHSAPTISPSIQYIEKTLSKDESDIDLALSLFILEKELNPLVNVSANLDVVSTIVEKIRKLPDFGDTSLEKMGAILRYIYTPGPWNNHQAYTYDFSSPGNQKLPNQMFVSHYLATKKGNCVSMPILLVILADRLGVNVKAAIAPQHMYARFMDDTQQVTNIEATSGTLATDSHYIRTLEISETALTNKLYLTSLSKKELIAYLLANVGRRHLHRSEFVEADFIATTSMRYFPTHVNNYLLKGSIQYMLLQKGLVDFRASGSLMTPQIKAKLDTHHQSNLAWFAKAERLGWREPSAGFNAKYEKSILRAVNK